MLLARNAVKKKKRKDVPPLHWSLCSTSVQHQSEQTNASSTEQIKYQLIQNEMTLATLQGKYESYANITMAIGCETNQWSNNILALE